MFSLNPRDLLNTRDRKTLREDLPICQKPHQGIRIELTFNSVGSTCLRVPRDLSFSPSGEVYKLPDRLCSVPLDWCSSILEFIDFSACRGLADAEDDEFHRFDMSNPDKADQAPIAKVVLDHGCPFALNGKSLFCFRAYLGPNVSERGQELTNASFNPIPEPFTVGLKNHLVRHFFDGFFKDDKETANVTVFLKRPKGLLKQS